MLEQIVTHFNQHVDLTSQSIELLAAPIHDSASMLCQSMLTQNTVLCAGSLHSTRIADQFCCYMQHHYQHERPALPCVSLCDVDTDHLISNLTALGKPGDSLLFFKHPDCNTNITQLITTCEQLNIHAIICGGLHVAQNNFKNTQNCISIPSEDAMSVMQVQYVIMHTLCSLIDYQLFNHQG
ncbi:MAG: hypothetical protein AAGF06_01880 [Pseudomonadota bacterium]